jgi:putative oxidoreductase
MPHALILVVGRILLSVIFLLGGFHQLTDISGTAAYFETYNLPAPTVLPVLTGILELFGGLAVLIGFQTRIAACALALYCIATALVAHMGWDDVNQLIHFQKNLAMAGGFLVLAVLGPGAYSLDSRSDRG